MPPPTRQRYNAKARASGPGNASHKKRNRHKSGPSSSELLPDSNADVLDTEAIDEAKRRRQELLQQSGFDPNASISSKKKKRLDNYINKQLRKEQRVDLLKKLSKSSTDISDRAKLVSTASLGTGRIKTAEQRIEDGKKLLNDRREKLLQARTRPEEDDDDADLDEDDGVDISESAGQPSSSKLAGSAGASTAAPKPSLSPSTTEANTPLAPASNIGSALKLGADGKPIAPVIRVRKRKRGVKTAWGRTKPTDESESSDFDSSESEDDMKGKVVRVVPDPMQKQAEREKSSSQEADDQLGQLDDVAEQQGGAGDTDEEEEAIFIEAMKRRGMWVPGMDGREDVEGQTGSEGSGSGDDDEDGSESGQTDEDEEAVLLEAMRRRGMWVPGMDGKPDIEGETGSEAASGDEEDEDDDEESEGAEDGEAESKEDADVDLPWLGFGDEEVDAGSNEEESEAGDDSEGESEDEDEDDEDDSEESGEEEEDSDDIDLSAFAQPHSRRRGIEKTERSSGFKDWAKAALGFKKAPSPEEDPDGAYKGPEPVAGLKQRVGDLGPNDGVARGPLGAEEAKLSERSPFAQRYYEEAAKHGESRSRRINVNRSDELQESRLKLPVLAEEDRIIQTIMENPVTVLCGETGSGKTTQVPQFLYEMGFGSGGTDNPGMIGITQPRRVAALSMAARVGSELSLPPTRVSHQIRYDATVSSSTSIKFMTDGVMLRELAADFLLTKYSAIIVDEAHERSVNTDILIGVLSRIVRLRAQRWIAKAEPNARPLRLIIMSATLRVADFAENTSLFATPPPIISVEARQHPVTNHFARRTRHDYIEEATKKAVKIHARLPPGGILIFLTGQQEISAVCKRLEKRFGPRAIEAKRKNRERARQRKAGQADVDESMDVDSEQQGERIRLTAKEGDVEAEEMELSTREQDLAADIDDADLAIDDDPDALETDEEEEEDAAAALDPDLPLHLTDDSDVPMHILPLYSLLPSDRQMRVFEEPPEGSRLVVVATNVAETSLTIPGISYVIDSGRAKERRYDPATGIQSFEVGWISKASAQQRAGRAGRTGPGHCYRLYSSAMFEDHFEQFSAPEILRTPVEGLVLQMKAMNIDNVANFPFPTAPDRLALRKAERILVRLGALRLAKTAGSASGSSLFSSRELSQVTELGAAMSLFPLAPRFAKMLVQGEQHGCLPYIVALVAALSVGDPFLREQALEDDEDEDVKPLDDDALAEMAPEALALHSDKLRQKEERKAVRKKYFSARQRFMNLGGGLSDAFPLLSAVGAYEYEGGGAEFCQRNFLRPKAMEEIHKLRAQIAAIVEANAAHGVNVAGLRDPKLAPPSETQLKVVRQLIAAAFIDQVAVRADLVPASAASVPALQDTSSSLGRHFEKQVSRGAKLSSTRGVAYLAMGVPGEACFIHPSSALFHQRPAEWIVFTDVFRSHSSKPTADGGEPQSKVWLKTTTRINPSWLSALGRELCTFSKPAEMSGVGGTASTTAQLIAASRALKDRKSGGGGGAGASSASSLGNDEVSRRVMIVPSYGVGPAFDLDERVSGVGWELPPVAATQVLRHGRWETEMRP